MTISDSGNGGFMCVFNPRISSQPSHLLCSRYHKEVSLNNKYAKASLQLTFLQNINKNLLFSKANKN